MASFHRWFVLTVVASLYGIVQAQCIVRTLVPMAMMDASCSTASCASEDSSSADDLSALLLLARALEMDRANSANNGVDVNGLLNNLINALVYTATHNPMQSQGYAAQGYSGQGFSGTSNKDGTWSTPQQGYTNPSGSKNSKDNVLDSKLVGKTLSGGTGGDGSSSGGGVLDGVTNTLGGVTGDSSGSDGLLGNVGNTVGGLLGSKGSDGLLGNVGNTVGGLLGSNGSDGLLGNVGNTVGGLTGSKGSDGLLGNVGDTVGGLLGGVGGLLG